MDKGTIVGAAVFYTCVSGRLTSVVFVCARMITVVSATAVLDVAIIPSVAPAASIVSGWTAVARKRVNMGQCRQCDREAGLLPTMVYQLSPGSSCWLPSRCQQ
jgi:hypothetical protein